MQFFNAALRDHNVGAFTWSSAALVESVLHNVSGEQNIVIEYGPGTGAMTKGLLSKLSSKGTLIAVEANAEFVQEIEKLSDARIKIKLGRVENVAASLSEEYTGKTDLVISSIPLSMIDSDMREQIMRDSAKLLTPAGSMIIFHQYTLIPYFLLKRHFHSVSINFIFQNCLPCFVFSASNRR